MVSLTVSLSVSARKILLPVPKPLSSSGLEVLGATTMFRLKWKLRLPSDPSGLLMPLSKQAKKGIRVLGVVIDPDYHEEIGFFVHNESKKVYV